MHAETSRMELTTINLRFSLTCYQIQLHIGALGIFAAVPNSSLSCIEKDTKAPAAYQILLIRQAEPKLLCIVGSRFGTLSFTNSSPVLLPSVHRGAQISSWIRCIAVRGRMSSAPF